MSDSAQEDGTDPASTGESGASRKIWLFFSLLVLDLSASIILMTSIFPGIYDSEGTSKGYTLTGSILDLLILSAMRFTLAICGFLVSFYRGEVRQEYTFDLHHPNGLKKSRDELEQEALEQSFMTWLRQYVFRAAFPCELAALVTGVLCIVKCLVRLDVEIGTLADAEPMHPVLWSTILIAALFSVVETSFLDSICCSLGKLGNKQRAEGANSLLGRIDSSLSLPLLANDSLEPDEEECGNESSSSQQNDENARGVSDIAGDASYKASWSDLLLLCKPDMLLICTAFVFLLLAAAAQIYIPKYTGAILDALAETFVTDDDDDGHRKSMDSVPGFMANVKKLILASIFGGVFSGLRGSIFTVVGGRVNVRLRTRLMDSLLIQDIGFFDTTRTGDITSRLSSDTTLVGDQVTLNVNVFLRSLVQAIGVLIFMFMVSWQLSVLAFISVPAITVLSKWYGNFVRSLTKVMQTKLADGNAVSEAAISSMPTVRAFDAGTTEYKEFQECMQAYLSLNVKSSIAYCGYATVSTSLPQLVTA
jgi:hypothetical protein